MNVLKYQGAVTVILFCFTFACSTPSESRRDRATASPRTFFLGVAGHDSEAVFENEIRLAHQVLDERFCFSDARFLVNKKRTLSGDSKTKSGRAASRETLHEALAHYSSYATDDDILVLYIASHGKRSGVLLRNDAQSIDEILAPDALSESLLQAPMREQVVFISACYSGTFVSSLRSKDRVLVTAADRSSPSFGCKSTRELTFFGSAFWDKPPGNVTLNKRYVLAREEVKKWENALELPSSNPQLVMGSNVKSWNHRHCKKQP